MTALQSFNWTAGSTHTISVNSPQQGRGGYRYALRELVGWRRPDLHRHGGRNAHHLHGELQHAVSAHHERRPAAGSVTANPPSTDGYYASGASVQLTATANLGYQFTGWTGDLSGASQRRNR